MFNGINYFIIHCSNFYCICKRFVIYSELPTFHCNFISNIFKISLSPFPELTDVFFSFSWSLKHCFNHISPSKGTSLISLNFPFCAPWLTYRKSEASCVLTSFCSSINQRTKLCSLCTKWRYEAVIQKMILILLSGNCCSPIRKKLKSSRHVGLICSKVPVKFQTKITVGRLQHLQLWTRPWLRKVVFMWCNIVWSTI